MCGVWRQQLSLSVMHPVIVYTRVCLWGETKKRGATLNPPHFHREYFVQDIQQQLADRKQGCSIVAENEMTMLKEHQIPYSTLFDTQKERVKLKENL